MKRILHLVSVKIITFKSSYNWFKIDIHQQLRPLNANYLAMFKQSHKNPVSASAMLTGKFLRIRKVFATNSLLAEEFPNFLKMYEYYTKYPDNMHSVRMNWKVSRWCRKSPDSLKMESFCDKNLAIRIVFVFFWLCKTVMWILVSPILDGAFVYLELLVVRWIPFTKRYSFHHHVVKTSIISINDWHMGCQGSADHIAWKYL